MKIVLKFRPSIEKEYIHDSQYIVSVTFPPSHMTVESRPSKEVNELNRNGPGLELDNMYNLTVYILWPCLSQNLETKPRFPLIYSVMS